MIDGAESIKSFASFNLYPVISLISFNTPILFLPGEINLIFWLPDAIFFAVN